jgi:CRP/FNR family transcriptional regulator, cyclic AMP receptor protein
VVQPFYANVHAHSGALDKPQRSTYTAVARLYSRSATIITESSGSAEDELGPFLAHCHIRHVPPHNVVLHSGDESDALYYIIRGSVAVHGFNKEGRELVLAYLGPGDFFGEMGLFRGAARSAEVIARNHCDIAEISYPGFREYAAEHPDILFLLASQISARLYRTSRRVLDLAFLGVAGRVAQTLLDLAQQPDALTHPDGMQIKITRQEIAKIVGCSREMAGRVLKELQRQGLISARGKTVTVFTVR